MWCYPLPDSPRLFVNAHAGAWNPRRVSPRFLPAIACEKRAGCAATRTDSQKTYAAMSRTWQSAEAYCLGSRCQKTLPAGSHGAEPDRWGDVFGVAIAARFASK